MNELDFISAKNVEKEFIEPYLNKNGSDEKKR